MESSRCVSRCSHQILRSLARKSKPSSNSHIIHTNYLPANPTTTLAAAAVIRRSFMTTTSQRQGPSTPPQIRETRSTTAQPDADNQQRRQPPPRSPRSQRPFRSRDTQRIDLSSIPGMPSSYRPPPPSRNPEQAEAAAAKLKALFDENRPKRSTPTSTSTQAELTTYTSLDAYSTTVSSSNRTNSNTRSTYDLESLMDVITAKPQKLDYLNASEADTPLTNLRLRPTLGRTVNVTPTTGFNLTRAFRALDIKCNANSVRKDEKAQRFHMRKGRRRKLERSARWRVLFKEGFIAECARVRRMRVQGW